ncbi:Beta-chimaerin [Drechslerella dactyloides]|uniref:Beta-chimaerin n=1 Tax=Drechslerella dactyloides TaxID=74499 RepID=A0AAD6J6A8_DREDA|nr:Beta-chimaerin [Drechslerella dactyloides]
MTAPRGAGYPATNGFSHHQNAAGPSQPAQGPPGAAAVTTQMSPDVNEILQSELGVNALLSKLRESTISARDFAGFLKKRAQIEEDHAFGLKKLCRITHDTIHRDDGPRRGTLMVGLEESNRIHDRLADNGIAFATGLNTMSEELTELANNIDRGRKQWKQAAVNSEKKGPDSFHLLEKLKMKSDGLAEEYERIRNGGRSNKHFGLGGGRHPEEDARRKLEMADMEYQKQVEVANRVHHDLFHNERPQTVKALRDMILECDAGLSLQLQKFGYDGWLIYNGIVALNESFAFNNGRTVSSAGPEGDLRKALLNVDDERDMHNFIMEFASKAPPQKLGPMKFTYERHPALSLPMSQPPPQEQQTQNMPPVQQNMPPQQQHTPQSGPPSAFQNPQQPPQGYQQQRSASIGSLGGAYPPSTTVGFDPPDRAPGSHPVVHRKAPPSQAQQQSTTPKPVKPVFGVPLETLLARDGNAVPIVVIQCMTAVELYGLEMEGIYRQAGATSHILKIKETFDNDPSRVDFRIPDHFYQNVHSAASTLKQFFRELPDPVLTYALYDEFIESAKIDDDNLRRDSLHALINRLPDAHYATVRALVLHLNRVMQHSAVNKMNSWNLAICFGPTLMSTRPEDLRNTNAQNRALDTILRNALDIFDED